MRRSGRIGCESGRSTCPTEDARLRPIASSKAVLRRVVDSAPLELAREFRESAPAESGALPEVDDEEALIGPCEDRGREATVP